MKTTKKPNIKLVSHNRPPVEWESPFQACLLLRDEINSALRAGIRYKEIAEKARLSPGTVSRLADGETKDPRTNTVLVLLRVFGYRVHITKD